MDITTRVDASLHLTHSLISMLVSSGVLSREQVAQMLNEIIRTDKAVGAHNAAEVEDLIKKMFAPE